MQPCLVAEQWVCKRNEKSTAGAAKRASGDRLFFMKCAEGNALSCISDGSRMAETIGSVHDSAAWTNVRERQ